MSSSRSVETSNNSLSTATTIPDFDEIHDNYSKGVARGRHPNSFPRKSELWYHFHTSAERVERIKRGHGFWNVITDQSKKTETTCNDHEGDTNNIKPTTAEFNNMRSQPIRTVNGMVIDMKVSRSTYYNIILIFISKHLYLTEYGSCALWNDVCYNEYE